MANEQATTKTTKQPDNSVVLPEAVRRAAARATELSAQQKARETSGANGSRATMVFADVDATNPPVPDAATTAPTPSVTTSTAPIAPTTPKSYSESEFRAMVGRFEKAEQEKLNLIKRNTEYQRLLATLQVPPSDSNPAIRQGDTNPTFVPRKYITDKDSQEWTPELVDMARRAAKEVAEAEIAAIRGDIHQVRTSLGNVQTNIVNDARQNLYTELSKEVPDWEIQNNDEGFKSWLNQIDPLSGMQRFTLLNNAFNNGQASRVVAAFKGYKAELAALGPAQTQRSQSGNGAESSGGGDAIHSQSNPATTPTVDLTSLAAPGRARPGQTQASPDKPIITRAEIKEFYTDVTRGRYLGRENEIHAIEMQIQEASREGRIR